MTSKDGWGPGAEPPGTPPRPPPGGTGRGTLRRLGVLALVGLGVVVTGLLVRAPGGTAGGEITVETAPRSDPEPEPSSSPRPAPGVRSASFRALDARTLADRTGAIPMDPDVRLVASDDGELVAVCSETGGTSGSLLVHDTATLRPVAALREPGCGRARRPLAFSRGNDAVVLELDGAGSGSRQLERRPLDPGGVVTTVTLPDGFEPVETRPLEGRGVAVFGLTPDAAGGTTGPPRLLFLGTAGDEQVSLDGVTAGTQAVAAASPTGAPPVVTDHRPGLGWDVARDRLYVVHPDRERVTVVDLAAGEVVAERPVQGGIRSAPAAERGRLDPPPVATGTYREGVWKQALVSPDGARLYVTGWRNEVDETAEPVPVQDPASLGLQVIHAETLTEIARLDVAAESMTMSPDGRWLALYHNDLTPGAGDRPGGEVGLVATVSLNEVRRVGTPDSVVLGFSSDSSLLYLQSHDRRGSVLEARSLPSLDVAGRRRLPAGATFDPATSLLVEHDR